MTTRKRKGMLIKNTNPRPVEIAMATRTLLLKPGEEQLITADEVRDAVLREKLQVRAVSIVRPAAEEEEAALLRELAGKAHREETDGVDEA
ncbi:hypothetical protein [Rhodocaloribacter sp.]